jgi:hypothetical protein
VADPMEADNPFGIQLYEVDSPTGSQFAVQTEGEAQWYERQRDLYLEHNKFSNISDLEDLSRLLTLEIMIYRWSTWLTQGFDYLAARVDEAMLQKNIKEYSAEVRLLKQSLGIDRATREKDRGESVGAYVTNLLDRAKMTGVHRNKQYEFAVTNFWELVSMIRTYDRCDEQERRELDLSSDSIVDWVRTKVLPQWDELNESFREEQKIWIREL